MTSFACLPERRVRHVLESHLISQGWDLDIAQGFNRGLDIEATRNSARWVIRARVRLSPSEMIADYFAALLGEMLQRMEEETSKYSIALPDMEPFRRLWHRLPHAAKNRTRITALFVSSSGEVIEEI